MDIVLHLFIWLYLNRFDVTSIQNENVIMQNVSVADKFCNKSIHLSRKWYINHELSFAAEHDKNVIYL